MKVGRPKTSVANCNERGMTRGRKGPDSRRRGREMHVKRRNWSKAPAETQSPGDRSRSCFSVHVTVSAIVLHLDVATVWFRCGLIKVISNADAGERKV